MASVAALTAGLAVFAVAPAHAAGYDTASESGFVSRMNGARSRSGICGFSVSSDLVAAARKHSSDMAAQGRISHSPNLGGQVGGWQSLGENVGDGSSVDGIHNAFMASSTHRGHILSTTFTQVGVGVMSSGGKLWVTEIFRQPPGASACRVAAAPAPAKPRPAAAPRPAPDKAAAPAPAAAAAPVQPPAAPASKVPMSLVVGVPNASMGASRGVILGEQLTNAVRHPSPHVAWWLGLTASVLLGVAAGSLGALGSVAVSRRRALA